MRKLIESPYFARVDFQYPGEDESEKFYNGKFSYMDDNNRILIYDWRAPISSIYYDYELGDAAFEAQIGEIKGMLTLKRQFKIKNAKIEYAFESSINIDDNVLQRELSSISDERMKSIIAMIQKE